MLFQLPVGVAEWLKAEIKIDIPAAPPEPEKTTACLRESAPEEWLCHHHEVMGQGPAEHLLRLLPHFSDTFLMRFSCLLGAFTPSLTQAKERSQNIAKARKLQQLRARNSTTHGPTKTP